MLTVLIGLVKVAYNHYRIHKFTRIEQQRKLDEWERVLRTLGLRGGRAEESEVPFGARAIESGIEVEGVWVSRSNTPRASYAGSATSSPGQRASSSSASPRLEAGDRDIPYLAIPQALHSSHPAPGHEQRRSKSESPDRRMSDVDIQGEAPRPGHGHRQSYKPHQSSHLRYSSAELLPEEAAGRQRRASDEGPRGRQE